MRKNPFILCTSLTLVGFAGSEPATEQSLTFPATKIDGNSTECAGSSCMPTVGTMEETRRCRKETAMPGCIFGFNLDAVLPDRVGPIVDSGDGIAHLTFKLPKVEPLGRFKWKIDTMRGISNSAAEKRCTGSGSARVSTEGGVIDGKFAWKYGVSIPDVRYTPHLDTIDFDEHATVSGGSVWIQFTSACDGTVRVTPGVAMSLKYYNNPPVWVTPRVTYTETETETSGIPKCTGAAACSSKQSFEELYQCLRGRDEECTTDIEETFTVRIFPTTLTFDETGDELLTISTTPSWTRLPPSDIFHSMQPVKILLDQHLLEADCGAVTVNDVLYSEPKDYFVEPLKISVKDEPTGATFVLPDLSLIHEGLSFSVPAGKACPKLKLLEKVTITRKWQAISHKLTTWDKVRVVSSKRTLHPGKEDGCASYNKCLGTSKESECLSAAAGKCTIPGDEEIFMSKFTEPIPDEDLFAFKPSSFNLKLSGKPISLTLKFFGVNCVGNEGVKRKVSDIPNPQNNLKLGKKALWISGWTANTFTFEGGKQINELLAMPAVGFRDCKLTRPLGLHVTYAFEQVMEKGTIIPHETPDKPGNKTEARDGFLRLATSAAIILLLFLV